MSGYFPVVLAEPFICQSSAEEGWSYDAMIVSSQSSTSPADVFLSSRVTHSLSCSAEAPCGLAAHLDCLHDGECPPSFQCHPPNPGRDDVSPSDDLGDCNYFGGATCDCTCVEGGDTLCGTGIGFDCKDPASTCGEKMPRTYRG